MGNNCCTDENKYVDQEQLNKLMALKGLVVKEIHSNLSPNEKV